MELRHVRILIAVAEEGHITRAAERLGTQQPPLSRQVKAIEREIGVQLFRRKPRGVELTDAGRAFLDDARAMLTHLDHAFDAARRTARGEQGRLSVRYTSTAALHPLVPRIIRGFRQAFPHVSVTMSEGLPQDIIEALQREQVDVVFIGVPVAKPEGVAIDRLHEEPMFVALPRGHALARNENSGDPALLLKALAHEAFIFYGDAHGMLTMQSNAVIATCQAAGFSPLITHIVPDQISRLNLVAAELGVAIVPASLQRMNVDGVVYRRLKGPQLKVPLNLVSRRGETSEVLGQFLKMAKRTARDFDRGKTP